VTALEMTLYPFCELYAGALFFPIERSSEVLHAWRQWTETVPDELTSMGRVLRLPAVDEIPAAIRGRAFAPVEAAYLGDATSGTRLLRPLRELDAELDTFAAIGPPALAQLNMGPEQPVPSIGDGAFLAALPANAIDAILELVGPGVRTPLQSVEIRHLGGALTRSARRRRPANDRGKPRHLRGRHHRHRRAARTRRHPRPGAQGSAHTLACGL
jgi:hypothetical protein